MKLKIISLNLWYGGVLFDAALDFLRQQDADVIALQEVYDNADPALDRQYRSLITLRETLTAYPYYSFAPSDTNNLPDLKVVQGNAILSKLPVAQTNTTFFTYPYRDDYVDGGPDDYKVRPRNLQHAELLSPVGTINVCNFHGVWGIDGDDPNPERMAMSQTIVRAVEGLDRVIVVGDTNAKETNPAMRAVEEHLISVFGSERTTSFNMRRKDNPGYATAAVDHMYVSPSIKILSKQCPDVDVSDHLPLIVELEIPEGTVEGAA